MFSPRMPTRSQHALCAALVWIGGIAFAPCCRAQCDQRWIPGDWAPGLNGPVYALTTWDPDGNGPQPAVLVAAGAFTEIGGIAPNRIAAWDGETWRLFGPGFDSTVWTLAVFRGELYAGGGFSQRIARWDGTAWQPVGTGVSGGGVYCMLSYFDQELYVGGDFSLAGGNVALRIAKWNPVNQWRALSTPNGNGVSNGGSYSVVYCLGLQFSDIVAGGSFRTAGGATANNIARWRANTWQSIGTANGGGLDGPVFSLLATTDQSGNSGLVAGGSFTNTSGASPVRVDNIAGLFASNWQPLASSGMSRSGGASVFSLINFGPPNVTLVALGAFDSAGGVTTRCVADWTGSGWNGLGPSGGFLGVGGQGNAAVRASAEWRGELVAGGEFETVDQKVSPWIARYTSAPYFTVQPTTTSHCTSTETVLSVQANVSGPVQYLWQWMWESNGVWTNVVDGTNAIGPSIVFEATGSSTSALHISNVAPSARSVIFRCVAQGTNCGSATSRIATLTHCPIDFTCDDFVDFFDYDRYVDAFQTGDMIADFNRDGFLDFFDYDEFVLNFEQGC